ncbi:MAG: type IX secretion system membrane protein PorP/SprF [Lutibacter sp.]|jgi:type IX secretion system PorP/SprF family membrane protein|uniref:PorP/SprF family type IX secretion system membrane protein n=1 Tax=Lutibacter sp. TaxID=1925666 RepID=UPI00299D10F6|nr:type IX secretion system membrane protein PorP/SprF [Lutibacter sp.]MDX1829046.1 type IX secretion system membrane protein PorP/SprF [Lutibacter sp.]
MKSIKSLLKLSVLLFSVVTIYGQQDAQYTQYMYNMNILNPAYAGSQGTLSIGLLGRTQWVGIDGAPKTFTASINAPMSKNVGFGFSVIADKIGPVKEQNAYADFSYTIKVSDKSHLAFGLKGGFTFMNANLSLLDLGDNVPDDLFTNVDLNRTSPNFGVGAFYYTNKFYIGLSAPNMLKTLHFEKKGGVVYRAVEEVHYFLTSGIVFSPSDNLKLKPSIMLKAVNGAPPSMDISGNALIQNKFELGLSWRIDDSVSALFNLAISPNIKIGYAYDYTLTNLGDFNSGSHEVFFLYNISNSKSGLSPRFF